MAEPLMQNDRSGGRTLSFYNVDDKDFTAVWAAEEWLATRGISVGRMQAGNPRGLLVGDFDIQKWRNLSRQQRLDLDGEMVGGRYGPVVVYLKPRAVHHIDALRAKEKTNDPA